MQIKFSASAFAPRNCNGNSHKNRDLRCCDEMKQDVRGSDLPTSVVPLSKAACRDGRKFPSLSIFKRKFSSVDKDVE